MPARVRIKVDGILELRELLPGQPRIVTRGLRKILRQAAKEARDIFREFAPRLTGRLARSARPSASVFSARVLFNAIARDGKFPYGYALNSSTKWGHRGYLDDIADVVAEEPGRRAVEKLGDELERIWAGRG